MSDLWVTASTDAESERLERLLTSAKVAATDVWPFLAAATSHRDFENRKALAAERIEAVASRVAGNDPVMFGVIHSSLLEEFTRDFTVLHTARLEERKAARAAEERQAEALRRSAEAATRRAQATRKQATMTWDEAFEKGRSEGMDHGEAADYANSVAGKKESARKTAAKYRVIEEPGSGKFQAQVFKDGVWGDLGDAKDTRAEADAKVREHSGVDEGKQATRKTAAEVTEWYVARSAPETPRGFVDVSGPYASEAEAQAAKPEGAGYVTYPRYSPQDQEAYERFMTSSRTAAPRRTAAKPAPRVAGEGAQVRDPHNSGMVKGVPAGTVATPAQGYVTWTGQTVYDWTVEGLDGEWQLQGTWTEQATASLKTAAWACPSCFSTQAHTKGGKTVTAALSAGEPVKCGGCGKVATTAARKTAIVAFPQDGGAYFRAGEDLASDMLGGWSGPGGLVQGYRVYRSFGNTRGEWHSLGYAQTIEEAQAMVEAFHNGTLATLKEARGRRPFVREAGSHKTAETDTSGYTTGWNEGFEDAKAGHPRKEVTDEDYYGQGYGYGYSDGAQVRQAALAAGNPYQPTENPYVQDPPNQPGMPDNAFDGPMDNPLTRTPPPTTTRPRQQPNGAPADFSVTPGTPDRMAPAPTQEQR